MTALLSFLSGPVCRNLVLVLLHTLWQGPLIALVAFVALRKTSAEKTLLRYGLSVAALAALCLAALLTYGVLTLAPPAAPQPPDTAVTADLSSESQHAVSSLPPNPATHRPSPAPPAGPSATMASWYSTLAALYLVGVSLMLLRVARRLVATRRLIRACIPADDPALVALVDEIRSALRLSRRVAVFFVDDLAGPAVMGILYPALLVPPSILSGLSPDHLRAFIAHELAHVRRFDCLVNFAQLLIESLLFFNPAVWWLSHHIRIEREACCDASAARLLGGADDYASALAEVASRMHGRSALPRPALAFSDDGPSNLRDRVRRLLLPGYRPHLRLSWPRLAVALLAGALILAALLQTSRLAVTAAARILSPQERIDLITEAKAAHSPPVLSDNDTYPAHVSGTISTADGAPVDGRITVRSSVDYFDGKGSMGTAHRHVTFSVDYLDGSDSNGSNHSRATFPDFQLNVPPGVAVILFDAPGYAPTIVGPFILKAGEPLSGLEVLLEKGFTASILLTDPSGSPVPDAQLRGGVPFEGIHVPRTYTSDSAGKILIENAVSRPYSLQVASPGFASERRSDVLLSPGSDFVWQLSHAAPTTGRVVDLKGNPVPMATLRLYGETFPNGGGSSPTIRGPVLTATDPNGSFTLDTLVDGHSYLLLAEAPGRAKVFVKDVTSGVDSVLVSMPPAQPISGVVRGDLSLLKTRGDEPIVRYYYEVSIKGYHSSGDGGYVPLQEIDGEARFTIDDPLPAVTHITAGPRTVKVNPEDFAEPVLIDLSVSEPSPPTRKVTVTLVVPDGHPAPQGLIHFRSSLPDAKSLSEDVALESGQASFQAYVGSYVVLEPRDLVGYWAPDFITPTSTVPPGDEPFPIALPTLPAGAVTGYVRLPSGTPPFRNISVRLVVVERPPLPDSPQSRPYFFHGSDNVSVNPADGAFTVTPIPFGGVYALKASVDKCFTVTEPFRIDDAALLHEFNLKIPKGLAAEFLVLDENGRPLEAMPVKLQYDADYAGNSWGPSTLPGPDGLVRFEALNPDVPGSYWALVDSTKDYQPTRVRLKPGDRVQVRLEKGLVAQGHVINADSGKPVPGAKVQAYTRQHDDAGRPLHYCTPEAPTDAEGRFRFSNLGSHSYQFYVLGAQLAGETVSLEPPFPDSIEFKVTIPDRSPLRHTEDP